MIDESQQETLINWRCLGKFCFLFWALFARLPPRLLNSPSSLRKTSMWFLFLAPKLFVCSTKLTWGGETTTSYCGKLSITHLLESILIIVLTSVSLTKKTETKVKLIGKFPTKVQTWKGIYRTNCLATICFTLLISQLHK